jgi:phospholipid transport system transporter-binding protein
MIECNDGRCTLKGAVNIESALALREEGLRLFTAADVTLDLAGVTEVDSTALSLLFENLTSLARLYGVTELVAAE